jgi:Gram-negative bacterial TonB protein C-terminal
MNKQFLLATSLALAAAACASRNSGVGMAPEQAARCADLADSVSKYVSQDALPLAHLVGNPRLPRIPATLGPGDSVYVEFLVSPDGVADTSSVQILGASDPEFVRTTLAFAAQSRFMPAQSLGCPVPSKYNLVVKSRASTTR